KLNDIERFESTMELMDNYRGIPAHIWLKYLKMLLVVTQTSEERKAFEKKCATALKVEYNTALAEFVVTYLVNKGNVEENHVLWARLLSDYDLERPDFGKKLRELLEKDENKISIKKGEKSMQVLLKHHCKTWDCSRETRNYIKMLVDDFNFDLKTTKPTDLSWEWKRLHKYNIEEVKRSEISLDIRNAIVRYIFERLVEKFDSDDTFWIEYIRFVSELDGSEDFTECPNTREILERRIGLGYLSNTSLDLAKRGSKRCPSVRLNHLYLQEMFDAGYEKDQIDSEVKAMLSRIRPKMYMTVELHLDYLAYRVRTTKSEYEEQVASLREAFQKAWDDLSAWYGDQADTRYEILQLWAQVEYSKLSSPENGEFIWRQILAYPESSHYGLLWHNFAQMEFQYNPEGRKTRGILLEALKQPTLKDGLMVQEMLRRYERTCGSYDSIAACQGMELPKEYYELLLNPMHSKWRNAHPRQQQEKSSVNQRQPKKQTPKAKEPVASTSAAAKAALKRIAVSETRESHFKYSTQLETNKIFVKNLHNDCTKVELQNLFSPFGTIKDVRLVQKQNKPGIAYVEFDVPSAAQSAVTGRDGYLLGGTKVSKIRKRIPVLIVEPLQISVMISNPPPRNLLSPSKKWTSSSNDSAKAKVAPKRRMPTTLIPTALVRKEVAEKKLRLNDNTEEQKSAEAGPNGKIEDSKKDKEEAGTSKSNDDFRKLLNL
ncbi:hypothetical protein KR026_008881, partial [Drosophila bipectinata]